MKLHFNRKRLSELFFLFLGTLLFFPLSIVVGWVGNFFTEQQNTSLNLLYIYISITVLLSGFLTAFILFQRVKYKKVLFWSSLILALFTGWLISGLSFKEVLFSSSFNTSFRIIRNFILVSSVAFGLSSLGNLIGAMAAKLRGGTA